jgi:multidrug efflux pump
MNISELSIRRPVFATVISIIIILFGFIGYQSLGIREFPNVDNPVITVATNYIGANADVIESQITEPLEESITGIGGIKSISSTSREGRSTINVEFDLDTDLEAAANDVRDRVSRAVSNLPKDSDPPIVSKSESDAFPIIFLTIRSEKRGLLELTDLATNLFKERFKTINGVSEVQIWGEKKYSMRLWIDPIKLSAYQLTISDVQEALLRENIELPTGRIEGENVELTIRTISRLQTEDDFNNLIIKEANGVNVKFRDIGMAILGPENLRTALKRDGLPMVGTSLVAQSGSNHLEIASDFYKKLEAIRKNLPDDIITEIGFDTTKYVQQSIDEVIETISIAFGLVVLIILIFLRDWRTTLIPSLAIPVSLIGAFFIMYISGFTINVLTLLGIVLAIGLVVDDAIVVLENIYSKIESGLDPKSAAYHGTKEVYFAVIATTLVLVAVFLPIIFLEGLVGRLFREFGFVLAGAVVISSIVALTLTPMLASRILKNRKPEDANNRKIYNSTEKYFVRINQWYERNLRRMLYRWYIPASIILVSSTLIVLIGRNLPNELSPNEDRSNVRVVVSAPEGTSYAFMQQFMDNLQLVVDTLVPENDGVITVTSPGFGASSSVNSGFVRLRFSEPDNRNRSQTQIAQELTQQLKKYSDANMYVIEEPTISGGNRGGLPVQFVLQAPSFKELEKNLPLFLEKARERPEFSYVDANLKFNKPELNITLNRDKAKLAGINTIDVATTLQLGLSGQRFDYFIRNNKQYQVIGQFALNDRNQPTDLKRVYLKNSQNQLIPLENLIDFNETSAPPQLFRYNRFVSATVSASLANGYTIGDGLDAMNDVADNILPEGFQTDVTGLSKNFQESSNSLVIAFILALALVYLVLAAQFESFIDPLIILFTVPLALFGAVTALWYFQQTLNIFSQIGIIMLVGLVTKNGILIVEFANQKRKQGLGKKEAIIMAAASRFRPILMTSLATILGVLPIALALGAGAESRVGMGIAVTGGMALSTFLTLFVIPSVYLWFSPRKSYDPDKVIFNSDITQTNS